MQFSGEITADVEEEIRDLYFKRSVLYPIIYALLGIAMIGMAVFVLIGAENSFGKLFGLFLLFAALALFVYAFAMPQIAWRFFWPKFLSVFGRHLSCEVSSSGIKLKPDVGVISWKDFVGIKQSDSLVLLYLDSATTYPVHRSMVANSSEWAEFANLLKQNIHRKIW